MARKARTAMSGSNQLLQINASDARWRAFVDSAPQANIFHHPAWSDLLATCYGYRPFVIALLDDENHISAGLPVMAINSYLTGRRWVSLPFSDYCLPLYKDQDSFERLTQKLVSLYQQEKIPRVEMRWELPSHPLIQYEFAYFLHKLDLNRDAEAILKNIHRTQRQNIHTAEKNGVQVEWGNQLVQLREFYRLHCMTRRRQGIPVQPWRFFELLLKEVIEKGLGFILLAYAQGECLAAGIFLHWQKTLTYKYAASSDAGQSLRPNHLLTWTAIRWGCEHGYDIFDLGRTEVTNEGLRTFKNRWGVQETPLIYSNLSAKKVHLQVNRLTPIMHVIIRNSPLCICRLSGSALYRHFG